MAKSGQITVTTAGTAVQGTDQSAHLVALKAHPDNTDAVWVGNVSGDVSNANGFPIDTGETVIVVVSNLNELWFDADVNGEKICWLLLD
jgi:hypothetical protein